MVTSSKTRMIKVYLWKHHLWFSLDKWGFWFYRKGDDICYVWPWVRHTRDLKGRRYISLCCNGYFDSLRELDQFWIEYEAACKAAYYKMDD